MTTDPEWKPESCAQMLARLRHARHEMVMAFAERDEERLFEVLRNIDAVIATIAEAERIDRTHHIVVLPLPKKEEKQ
jgi:hypothetical protein